MGYIMDERGYGMLAPGVPPYASRNIVETGTVDLEGEPVDFGDFLVVYPLVTASSAVNGKNYRAVKDVDSAELADLADNDKRIVGIAGATNVKLNTSFVVGGPTSEVSKPDYKPGEKMNVIVDGPISVRAEMGTSMLKQGEQAYLIVDGGTSAELKGMVSNESFITDEQVTNTTLKAIKTDWYFKGITDDTGTEIYTVLERFRG